MKMAWTEISDAKQLQSVMRRGDSVIAKEEWFTGQKRNEFESHPIMHCVIMRRLRAVQLS